MQYDLTGFAVLDLEDENTSDGDLVDKLERKSIQRLSFNQL